LRQPFFFSSLLHSFEPSIPQKSAFKSEPVKFFPPPKWPRRKNEEFQAIRFALAFAAIILFWAVLHDIHLIHSEPKHFTEYHKELLPLSNLNLLALQYATVATLGPGLAFGFLAWFICRVKINPPLELGQVLPGFAGLILVLELLLLGAGNWARQHFIETQATFYPEAWYPELSEGIVYTQTINISAYLFVPLLSVIYLICMRWMRKGGGSF